MINVARRHHILIRSIVQLILIVFISLIMAQACVAGWGKHDYNLTYADEEKNQQVFGTL